MSVFRTSQGRTVVHCHIPNSPCSEIELTPEEIKGIDEILQMQHPDVVKVGPATRTYNCHGYTLAAAHGWFNHPESFFSDDFFSVSFDDPRVDDVVVYYNNGTLMHTAVVIRVSSRQIIKLRSKWAAWPLLVHGLHDVRPVYGEPVRLLRRRAAPQPFDTLMSDKTMTEPETRAEMISRAIENLSRPNVYLQVELGSTPEATRLIIESLPDVQDLIALGPDAGQAALSLLQREGDEERDDQLASIALYVLQRVPTPDAVAPLARAFSEGKFTGMNRHLAADALLTVANIEAVSEDSITVASREAEKLK